jgi:acetyl-CoA acetyltransferase
MSADYLLRKCPVAIVGVYNTKQARSLPGETSRSIISKAILGAIADSGLPASAVNGIAIHSFDPFLSPNYFATMFGGRPCWTASWVSGIAGVSMAASAIAAGYCDVVVLATGQAGMYGDHRATAPWTRPAHEFVLPFGLYTAVEFALPATRYMHLYGTKRESFAEVAATVRNNGSKNPEAVYYGKGPFTRENILKSRPICDPFNLLDCSMTSEGGCAVVLARADRVKDTKHKPAYVVGVGVESMGQGYSRPPVWEHYGDIGKWAADRAFEQSGLSRNDVDVFELYDAFSFEVIRQFEAYGFCKLGEGGDFVMDGRIHIDGEYPICTDGGTMSFSHAGTAQTLQKVIAGALQLQGRCGVRQVKDAKVSISAIAGVGALANDVALLSVEPSA